MKFTAIICAVLALTLLAGCQNSAVRETPAPNVPVVQTPAPQEDPAASAQPAPADAATINRTQAVQIALAHAGLTADQVSALETDVDRDNGVIHYEVEFHFEGYEYDYEIGTDGTVLWHTKERD